MYACSLHWQCDTPKFALQGTTLVRRTVCLSTFHTIPFIKAKISFIILSVRCCAALTWCVVSRAPSFSCDDAKAGPFLQCVAALTTRDASIRTTSSLSVSKPFDPGQNRSTCFVAVVVTGWGPSVRVCVVYWYMLCDCNVVRSEI